MSDEFNPYTVLEVSPSASEDEIKAAWREAAQRAHPDRPGGSAERMMEVNQAYQLLSDPGRRAQYDAGRGTETQVSLEQRAKDFVRGLCSIVIRSAPASANMVVLVMNGIGNQKAVLTVSRQKTQTEIEGLRLRLTRLKGPPQNFIEDLIRSEIAKGEQNLLMYDLDELVMGKALEILKDFSYEETVRVPSPYGLLVAYENSPMIQGFGYGG